MISLHLQVTSLYPVLTMNNMNVKEQPHPSTLQRWARYSPIIDVQYTLAFRPSANENTITRLKNWKDGQEESQLLTYVLTMKLRLRIQGINTFKEKRIGSSICVSTIKPDYATRGRAGRKRRERIDLLTFPQWKAQFHDWGTNDMKEERRKIPADVLFNLESI